MPYQKDLKQILQGGILINNLEDPKQDKVIKAHNQPIINITFNSTGSIFATASNKGNLIKIWETLSGECLTVIRWGYDSCLIHQIAFDEDDNW